MECGREVFNRREKETNSGEEGEGVRVSFFSFFLFRSDAQANPFSKYIPPVLSIFSFFFFISFDRKKNFEFFFFFWIMKTVNASIGCFTGEFRIRFCGKDFSRDFFYTRFLELRNLLWNFLCVENFSTQLDFFTREILLRFCIDFDTSVFMGKREVFLLLENYLLIDTIISEIMYCLFFKNFE